MYRRLLLLGVFAGSVLLLLGSATDAFAGDYYTSVPFLPTVLIGPDAEGATPVETVYGKEYSHTDWFTVFSAGGDPRFPNIEDHDAFAAPDPLQVVSWDGIADPITGNSGSTNAFDFGNDPDFHLGTVGQVDALANRGDFLFNQVVGNVATLLFSMTADVAPGLIAKDHVHYEDPAGLDGTWATIETAPAGPGPGPGVNHHVVEDLDALEVWGPEPPSHFDGPDDDPVDDGYVGPANTADADRFSLDLDGPIAGGVSVWGWDIPTKTVFPYIPHADIVASVEALLFGGAPLSMPTRDLIDVDGTMVRDVGAVGEWDDGDELLFTIDPLDAPFDVTGAPAVPALGVPVHGGEIMHLVNGPGGALGISFLSHGGHLWDSLFSPAAAFGYEYNDVDALEAVGTLTGEFEIPTPEPTSMMLMLCGIAGLISRRRR